MLSKERRTSLTLKSERYAANLDGAAPYLTSRGITKEAAQLFQLGCVPEGQENAGRLAIPYVTPAGVVAIKYRCTDLSHNDHKSGRCPKYLAESGGSVHLYNAQALIGEADAVVLTEGELDAISVQAFAGLRAVAYPGVDTWKKQEHWKYCFDGVGEVIILADGDEVGRKAAESVRVDLNRVDFLQPRVVQMPDGMDANSYINQLGVAEFQKLIQE